MAASLLGVLIVAHALMVAGREIPVSPWTPFAFLWQDLAVVALFAVFERIVRSRWLVWSAYGVLTFYAAANVVIARVLSSPLTPSMLRAVRGPLTDSVYHHVTPANVAAMVLTLGSAVIFPLVLARRWIDLKAPAIVLLCGMIVAGPYAVSRIDTAGLHRNAFGALWPAWTPQPSAVAADEDWRTSPFESTPGRDLASYRGAAAGRNVVLIMLESTGAAYLRPYGAEADPMPHLTALAENALLFEDAFAVYPESIKGLFAVLCSRYPAFRTAADAYAGVSCASLAARLRATGYRTALFHSGRFGYLDMKAVIERRGFEVLEDAGAIGGNVESSFGVDEPATVTRMLAWIDSISRSEPFFITYLPVAGHHPYSTVEPGPFLVDTDFGRYQNALFEADQALGKFLDGLQARGVLDNTLFVFAGDHGEAFGQHDGNYGHTHFIYNENVRVPFIVVAPGAIAGQTRVSGPLSLIDTAPIIFDVLGLAIPPDYQGSSPLDGKPRMALFFTDYALSWLGLVDSCWKFLLDMDSGRSRLYDVCTDPQETRNLAQTEPDRVDAYRNKLENWIGAQP